MDKAFIILGGIMYYGLIGLLLSSPLVILIGLVCIALDTGRGSFR